MSPLKRLFTAHAPVSRRRSLMLAAVVLWIAGCNPPSGTPVPVVSSSPATAASVAPGASPSLAGTTAGTPKFREDFDGTTLDEARWAVFKQSGVVALQEGKLELLNTNGKPDYPYVLTKHDIIPKAGPYYFEMGYTFLTSGPVAFCLDYLPAESPELRALTQPFMYTYLDSREMKIRFAAEKKDVYMKVVKGAVLRTPHVLRVEFDGNRGYRVIANGAEISLFESARRPAKFWIGYPKDLNPPPAWGRVQVDYVEADQLVTPASAKPLATPTPNPSGSPDPSVSPDPSASFDEPASPAA